MFDQRDGFSASDFNDADRQLARCASLDEIAQLIRRQPVYASPHYHAHLRQLRLKFQADAAGSPQAFEAFLRGYDAFFMLQHRRLHFTATEHGRGAAPDGAPFAPPLLAAVLDAAAGRAPPPGPMHVLPRDQAALQAEVSALAGRAVALPPHAPTPGALFALLALHCLACEAERVAVRCYAVDLRADPTWRTRLAHRQINGDHCPRCGSLRSEVARRWASEAPHPHDSLLMLACLVRAADHETIYLAPPGNVRRAEHDRVHEIQLDMLERQLGPRWLERDGGSAIRTNGIAYGADELEARLRANEGRSQEQTEYDDTVQALVHKLASGVLPVRDAQNLLQAMVGPLLAKWPLFQAVGGEPYPVFVRRLILAACADARGLPALTRLAAHCGVADALLGLHEVGLAEMRIATARDLLRQVPPEQAAGAEAACLEVEEALHRARGEHAQADALRARLMASGLMTDGTPEARRALAGRHTNEGLAHLREGRLAEALAMIDANVAYWRSLHDVDPTDAAAARDALSANLANLAAVLDAIANGMELLDELQERGMQVDRLSAGARQQLQRLGSAERLMALQQQLLETLPPLMERVLPGVDEPATLRARAEQLLEEAIALAQQVADHDYLSIQWMQLAELRAQQPDPAPAQAAREAALRHATQAAADGRVAQIAWSIAIDAHSRGRTAALFDGLETAVRAALRSQVRTGQAPALLAEIGPFALASAASDDERLRAIAIAEAAKNLPLARSMHAGAPLAAPAASAPQADALARLQAAREQLRLQAMWGELDDAQARTRLAELEAQIARQRQELAWRDPRYAAWHDATFLEPPDGAALAALLGQLGESTTLVGFAAARGRLFGYAAWAGGVLTAHVPIEKDADAALARLWLALSPRLQAQAAGHRVLISPCDEVGTTPWAALPLADGRRMVHSAAPVLLHGLGMLAVCRDRPPLALQRAVVLGGPARPERPALPAAVDEAADVAALLRAAGLQVAGALAGADATVARLAAEAAPCHLVHLACHAEPPSGQGAPRLLLTPDLLAGDSGDLDDERIVAALALQPGALVVMASCSSGAIGERQRFISRGLVPAWLVVGASAVLATLWPVADDAARALLPAFYRHLLQGLAPAQALAAAQADAVDGRLGDALRDPRHWAAYQLHGLG